MELLLPMAAQKLDLTFNIEANVPTCAFVQYCSLIPADCPSQGVYSDYARIRQGKLMERFITLDRISFILQF
jgi:hypothetical protein